MTAGAGLIAEKPIAKLLVVDMRIEHRARQMRLGEEVIGDRLIKTPTGIP
jgi:hypothetical protein